MRTWLRYLLILVFGLLWFAGCSSDLAKWLYKRDIIHDDYRYGDLYRLSNLPQFRVPVEKCTVPKSQRSKNIQLVLAGDSFTEEGRIEQDHFDVKVFDRTKVFAPYEVKKQAGLKRILVIETTERHFRERFTKPWDQVSLVNHDIVQHKEDFKWTSGELLELRIPYETERHEAVLFSSDFMLRFKEWKAALNYRFFDRVDESVRLSSDGKNIFYGVDSKPGISSCFDKVEDQEINQLVNNINTTYADYKKMGFDEVYLSIIPNKTSILGQDLGDYNRLVERIQSHPALQMPHIDMLKPLQKGGEKLFDKGDSHWNCEGKQIWVDEVNRLLVK
jgi:hypothetical protein